MWFSFKEIGSSVSSNTWVRQTQSSILWSEIYIFKKWCLTRVLLSLNRCHSSNDKHRVGTTDTYLTKLLLYCDQHQWKNDTILCRISTCDAWHFVGEVALFQVLKMCRQSLSSWCQGTVVPGLSFSLEKTCANGSKNSQISAKLMVTFILFKLVYSFTDNVHDFFILKFDSLVSKTYVQRFF